MLSSRPFVAVVVVVFAPPPSATLAIDRVPARFVRWRAVADWVAGEVPRDSRLARRTRGAEGGGFDGGWEGVAFLDFDTRETRLGGGID